MQAPNDRFPATRSLAVVCLLATGLLLCPTARADDAQAPAQPTGQAPATDQPQSATQPDSQAQSSFPATSMEDQAPAPSLSALQQQIDDFVNSPDYRFAPDTLARARALYSVAEMAGQRGDTASRDQGARDCQETLKNARTTADNFRAKYAGLLKLEAAAAEAAGNPGNPSLNTAKDSLSDLIHAFEHGDMNQAASLHDKTSSLFLSVLHDELGPLLQQTDAALLAARRNNADRYAPQSYAMAKQWLSDALQYNDGLSNNWPAHPRLGLKLANQAEDLAKQIRLWRRKPDSYERLVLQARADRIADARAAGLPLDASDPGADIDNARIVKAIAGLKQQNQQQQQDYQKQLTALEAQYQERLDAQSEALRNQLAQEQGQQMSQIKEAFRAKLERETFETRRQKQLSGLFKKGEVTILANLDGSILLRLSSLQFASGSTNIGKKYYDLLSRVRNGLNLYPDRKVVIEGHTDNRGDPEANRVLSLKRAETVRDFLVAAGMPAGRLKALGYGEVRPIASNDYAKGRAMNRRIDIIIQAPAK